MSAIQLRRTCVDQWRKDAQEFMFHIYAILFDQRLQPLQGHMDALTGLVRIAAYGDLDPL